MTKPKYTENPMAVLRLIVADATVARLAKLQKIAEKAKDDLESAQKEMAFAIEEAEAGELSDLSMATKLCLYDSDCWTDVIARAKAIDQDLYWGLMSNNDENVDLAYLAKVYPDFNAKPGVHEGLERFKDGE